MTDEPGADALVAVVADFLRRDVMPRLDGQLAFDARVAANVLDLVVRELRLGPDAARDAQARLGRLLDEQGTLEALNRRLCERIRAGIVPLEAPGLLDHLRRTTLDTIDIDQPSYATAVQVRETGWAAVEEEPWADPAQQEDRKP